MSLFFKKQKAEEEASFDGALSSQKKKSGLFSYFKLSPEQKLAYKAEKQRQKALKKKAFHDKYFTYVKTIDISEAQDGSMVREIRKNSPLPMLLCLSAFLLLLVLCFFTIDYTSFHGFQWDSLGDIFVKMFTPMENSLHDWRGYWNYIVETAIPEIIATNEMCFIGTVAGSAIAIPVAYLCATNINKKPYLRGPVRVFNDILRTIPQMVMALLLRLFFGPNMVTGIISIAVFTLGIMYQLMYEYIETLEMSPFEAIRSSGGGLVQCISIGLRPETKPMFFANALYTFEINIRASVILGFVGAGGFGYVLNQSYSAGYYDEVGAIIIPLFLEVIILQIVSNIMGRKSR